MAEDEDDIYHFIIETRQPCHNEISNENDFDVIGDIRQSNNYIWVMNQARTKLMRASNSKLDNKEFFNVVNILSKKTKYLYIDDFFLEKNFLENKIRKKINGYTHTYFDEVFDHDFKKIYAENSPYSEVKFANSGCALYKFIH